MELKELFSPRSVAVAGSPSPGKLAYVLATRLLAEGQKNVYALNPKGKNINDIPGFISAQDVPEPLDLVVIASPAFTVKDVLTDCGKAGVKAAIIITSGFSEADNSEGEAEIKAIADHYGIRYVGPNCAGLINTHSKLFATLEESPPPGAMGLISQSGSVGGVIMAWAEEQGLGISKFISYGNGSDLNELEMLSYLGDDPDTKVIAIYLENIQTGRRFMQVLQQVTAKKPVIVIKSGRYPAGQRATLSHTGSLAGADNVYNAIFRDSGALRVDSIGDMFLLGKGLTFLPEMAGKKILVVTNSGGPGVMSADAAEALKLELPEPSPQLKDKLKEVLVPHAGLQNPIDITVEGAAEEYYQVLKRSLPDYDAAIAIFVGTPYLESMPIAKKLVEIANEINKPILPIFEVGKDVKESKNYLQANNLPLFQTGEKAVEVLHNMEKYHRYLKAPAKRAIPVPASIKQPKINGMMPEPQALELLAENNIEIPKYAFVSNKKDLAKACEDIGWPLVMKVVSPQIIHKSDYGGVKLNISNMKSANAAFDRLMALSNSKKNINIDGIVLYPMLSGIIELIMGLKRDSQFGPVIMCGHGGIYSEVWRDTDLSVAPISKKQAEKMLKRLDCYPILEGMRGNKGANLEVLTESLVNFSQMLFKYPSLMEADLNPVFVDEEGIKIADARLIFSQYDY